MSQLRGDYLSLSRHAQPSSRKTILSGTKVKSRNLETTHTWVHVLALPLALTQGKCCQSLRASTCAMGTKMHPCFLRIQDSVFKACGMPLST